MRAIQGWWNLEWKIAPKVYNTAYFRAVIWSRFPDAVTFVDEPCNACCPFFCKCWRYPSVSVEDSQIFRTCQRKASWCKAYAPATEKHVARYQDQEMSCFSYLRFQTPCFGHENCSEELFRTIVFRFVRQSHLHELQESIHSIFHFDFKFTWFASHETSHVSLASHVKSFSVWLIQKLNLRNPHSQGNVLNISERTHLRSRLWKYIYLPPANWGLSCALSTLA